MLANEALFGSIIWLLTKDKILIRLSITDFLLSFRITHNIEGSWTKIIWDFSPIPEIYKFYFLQYLFIVILGTIIGDLILNLSSSDITNNVSMKRFYGYLILGLSIIVILCNFHGLYNRVVLLNLLRTMFLLLLMVFAFLKTKSDLFKLYNEAFYWAAIWLFLELSFESFEGGIKKTLPH